MPRRTEPLSPTRWSPRTILAIALGLGLLAGTGEVLVHYGRNSHHVAEAIFKSAARALRMAVSPDPRISGVPSTKGTL